MIGKLTLCSIVCLSSLLSHVLGQTNSCPIFGTNQQSQLLRSNEERIFMNFEAPSQCLGTVTGWRFCYYRNSGVDDDCGDDETCYFDAQFMVYRRVSETSNNYAVVSGSITQKTLRWTTVRSSSFTCTEEVLNSQEYFEIHKNDIVGACIKDVGSRYPLLLVGTSSGSNYRTYQLDKSGYQSCTTSEVTSVDTSDSDFIHRGEYTLHLYANIATNSSCTAGENPPPENAPSSPLSGTYLNLGSPFPSCGNSITKWHYCYYTEAAMPGSTLSMTVAVYSYSQESSTYILSPGSNLTITLNPIQTLAKIFCVEKTLSENDYVFISQGDVVGVTLPSTNAIPIVGISASSSSNISMHPNNGSPTNIALSEFTTLSNTALHLYATIIQRDVPTTIPFTTSISTESATTTPNMMTSQSTISMVTSQPLTNGGTQATKQTTMEQTTLKQTTMEQTTVKQTIMEQTTMSTTSENMISTDGIAATTSIMMESERTTQTAATLLSTDVSSESESTTQTETMRPSTLADTEASNVTTVINTMSSTSTMTTNTEMSSDATTMPPSVSTAPTETRPPATQEITEAIEITTEENFMKSTSTNNNDSGTTETMTEDGTRETTEAMTPVTSKSTLEVTTNEVTGASDTPEEVTEDITTQTLGSATSYVNNVKDTTSTEENASTVSFVVQDNQTSRSLTGGDISAIVLSILLVFGGLLLMAFIIIYVNRRKARKYSTTIPGFDNVMYTNSGHSTKDGQITIYDSIAEPYIYSETMLHLPSSSNTSAPLPLSEPDYEFTEDDSFYYTPMYSAHEYQQELEHIRRGSTVNKQEDIYVDPGNNEEELYSFLKTKKISHIPGHALIMGHELGSGHFGTVHQGEWKQAPKQIVDVALKSLKQNASLNDRVKFLQEAATMAQFMHPNVAKLFGVSSKNGQTLIVTEFLSKGDLHQYLQTLKPDPGELVQSSTPHLLLQFSQQICLGMSYLASTGYVHRDLAARNVLISNSLICKIADFGMSRDLNEGDYYTSSGGKIPLKWTAPEAIHFKKFSTFSDVWSYGCVLYEIWSLGHKPFETMGNVEVLQVLDTGGRLAPPPGCPESIYQIMIQCWNSKPKQRPEFRNILMVMLENEDIVLSIPPTVTVTHPQATTLGAPLKAGFQLYSELQKTYMPH